MNGDLLPVEGRVVMISGAARGIGAAVARQLHEDGYLLSLGAREPQAALAALATYDAARVIAAPYEAREPSSAAAWLSRTLARFGRLDAVVNNAGILRQMNVEDWSEPDLDEMWAVNVKGPLRVIRDTLPELRRSGTGRIVNIVSTDGIRYRDATASIGYVMTKHALMALTNAARFAGWESGVRVTALCPGAVETRLLAGIPGVVPSSARMSPQTVAWAVSFLLRLPNTASAAELVLNTRLESML